MEANLTDDFIVEQLRNYALMEEVPYNFTPQAEMVATAFFKRKAQLQGVTRTDDYRICEITEDTFNDCLVNL